jgi:predicted RecB family nuclease
VILFWLMNAISAEVFSAYLKCPTKCWLRAAKHPKAGSAYSDWLEAENDSYRRIGSERLTADLAGDEFTRLLHIESIKSARCRFALCLSVQVKMNSCVLESELHAAERLPAKGRGNPVQFFPIRFVFSNKLLKEDKLLLAFDAFVLSKSLGREVSFGKIIHGDEHTAVAIKTWVLAKEVQTCIERITELLSRPSAPDLVLNRHCGECRFQAYCRQKAVAKDDLSLLSGMTEKERRRLHSKGIFTVTQLSYTFRPRLRARRLPDKRDKYYHAIKALAIREKKNHVLGTPVYLDVEGLPHRDFYYLIGARIGRGKSSEQHSLWAATVKDESEIWNRFLDLLDAVENPHIVHYGSYETTFLKRMQSRYGVPSENSVAARVVERAMNLLSHIFAKVYFPVYSNTLKDVARSLGFKWSEPEASGSTAIVWRQQWERSGCHALKQKLINYNAEDCEALARLEERLVLFFDRGSLNATASPSFVEAESVLQDTSRTFKKNQFQFAEFEQINQAAYWNYQRERVLVRSSKHLKRIARKVARNSRVTSRANKIVDWPGPTACPVCGELKIYKHQTASKTVIDLRFGSMGIKKWTTQYFKGVLVSDF